MSGPYDPTGCADVADISHPAIAQKRCSRCGHPRHMRACELCQHEQRIARLERTVLELIRNQIREELPGD